jgi:hypothetical protein
MLRFTSPSRAILTPAGKDAIVFSTFSLKKKEAELAKAERGRFDSEV